MVVGRQGTVGAFPYPRAEGGPVARLPPTARYASAPTHRHQCTDAIGNAGRAPTRARHPPAPARPHAGLLAADPAIMDPPASTSRLGTEFDDFLFAPLGEDRNGVPLSIVSLLGRMDLDPWREADSLAGLPAEAAVQDPRFNVLAIGQLVGWCVIAVVDAAMMAATARGAACHILKGGRPRQAGRSPDCALATPE